MSISTQGFQVQNMPTYSAVNPSLVAFNPTSVSDGMMNAFNLAKALEEIKSKKALQAEIEATRQKRLAATNAQNELSASRDTASLGLVDPEAALKLGKIGQQQTLLEPTTKSKLSDLSFNTEKNQAFQGNLGLLASVEAAKGNADLSTIGPVSQATIAEAGARTAGANEDTQNATLRGSAQAADYRLKAKQAVGDYDRYDKEQQLVNTKLSDALDNAKTDQDVLRATRQAKLDKEKADTDYVKAHAKYLEAQGLNLPTKSSEKIAAQIQAASSEKHRLMQEKFVLPDGSVGNLASYIQAVYPEGGTEPTGKTGGFLGIGKSVMKPNPLAEDMLRQYQLQDKTIQVLTRQRNKALSGEGLSDEIVDVSSMQPQRQLPASGKTSALRVGEIKNGYKYLGGNPNDKASWQKQ